MRANAVKREPELQKFWQEEQIFERLSQNNSGEVFVLHDGPPYANGTLHMGHALNKTLKDIINRYQLLLGKKVRYVPGWDCHGLPIELKVIQELKPEQRQNLTPLELRQKAAEFALKTVEEQKAGFQRMGVWGDWQNPYLTLKPEYEAAQIAVFGQMFLKGYIYRGLKPVHWSPSSQTALAEAELEYPEGHISKSIYTAFKLVELSDKARSILEPFFGNLAVAIWTTTPWTIPGNLAVAVNPELNYAVVEVSPSVNDCQYWIVAKDMVEGLASKLGVNLTVKATLLGKDLEYCKYQHPLFDRTSPVIIGGDYITTESGTGLVHTAPGHGQEDYLVGQKYNLPILAPVDDRGNFTTEAGQFAGLNVLGDGNTAVIEALSNSQSLIKEEPYSHKYPYDWRTKKPTIFRATEQWFASVKGFKEEALKAISQVEWIPATGENRITPMVAERSDWCISRQRNWGVPIPVFYDEETNEPLLNEETINHIQHIFASNGSDAWYSMSVEELLPENYRHNGRSYRKGTDTMDVWFDSGSSWCAVAQNRAELKYPANMYLEGSDQHRGWFQSSLLTSVANNGYAPYRTVLTHGFVLDEQGRKMSKSLGNIIDPMIVINGGKNQQKEPAYGADVLRLWVSSVDYSTDVSVGPNILKQMGDVYRKIRNTARFLLGSLNDFDPSKNAVSYDQLPEIDRYMLHRTSEVFNEITDAYDKYQFFRVFQTVQNFCVVDLSNFYLDIAKDRLYISAIDSLRRRSCQTVMAIILENLAKAIAPILCHMAEDIWQFIPYSTPYKSVFEAGWVKLDPNWLKPEIAGDWERFRTVRNDVNKVMEKARTAKAIGSSLEAKVLLSVKDKDLGDRLAELLSPTPQVYDQTLVPITPEIIPSSVSTTPQIDGLLVNIIEALQLKPVQLTIAENINTVKNTIEQGQQIFNKYQRSLIAVGVLIAVCISLYILVGILNVINSVPLLQPIFTAIGTLVSTIYIVRNLVKSSKRDQVFTQVQNYKEQILGNLEPSKKPSVETLSTKQMIASFDEVSDQDHKITTNGVDELRYLFLSSQVELVDDTHPLLQSEYSAINNGITIAVVKADGEKCDRCWNYSTYVGSHPTHPALCERCVEVIE